MTECVSVIDVRRTAALPAAHLFLRRATARQHRRMDQASALTVLMAPGLRLESYGDAMRALELAYAAIDAVLVQSDALRPAGVPAYRPRGPGIRRDLRGLGLGESVTQCYMELEAPRSPAGYLGMRYVVEGAQLGARVICGALAAAFGDRMGEIGTFWMADPAVAPSWPGVLKGLAQVDSRDALAEAARAARQTFRHMGRYLGARESV